MAFPTLPAVNPDVGAPIRDEPNLAVAEFGDGYTQRAAKGLNHVRRKVSLSWTSISAADKDALVDFFRSTNGVDPFYWTAPGEPARLWRASQWSHHVVAGDAVWNVSATLEEVFDL